MQKILALCAALLLLNAGSRAQSCCSQYHGDFAMLAMNADFQASHADPLPLEYNSEKGSMITFKTLDGGKPGSAFYIPSSQPTNNVLIVFHEWWGLNDYIKQEAEGWQKKLGNVDVYAIDLYDGKVAITAEAAGKLSSSLDEDRGETIIKGLLSHIGNDKMIATIGWCMGGSWAFKGSLLAGDRSAATVMYYGFPEDDDKKIAMLKSDVLYMWASRDAHITKDVVVDFGQKVVNTGHEFEMHTYDAVHAFANPSNPNHDPVATKDAAALAEKFLEAHLKLE